MAFPRRQNLHGAAASLGLSALPRLACAQLYPSRPITLVVPFPAGGPVDTLARFLAERMRASLGQRSASYVIEFSKVKSQPTFPCKHPRNSKWSST